MVDLRLRPDAAGRRADPGNDAARREGCARIHVSLLTNADLHMRAKTSGAKAFIGCRASCPTFESIAGDVGVKTVFEISQDGERTQSGRIDLLGELERIPRGSRAPKREQVRAASAKYCSVCLACSADEASPRCSPQADILFRRATTWRSSTYVARECLC